MTDTIKVERSITYTQLAQWADRCAMHDANNESFHLRQALEAADKKKDGALTQEELGLNDKDFDAFALAFNTFSQQYKAMVDGKRVCSEYYDPDVQLDSEPDRFHRNGIWLHAERVDILKKAHLIDNAKEQ